MNAFPMIRIIRRKRKFIRKENKNAFIRSEITSDTKFPRAPSEYEIVNGKGEITFHFQEVNRLTRNEKQELVISGKSYAIAPPLQTH